MMWLLWIFAAFFAVVWLLGSGCMLWGLFECLPYPLLEFLADVTFALFWPVFFAAIIVVSLPGLINEWGLSHKPPSV